MLYRKIEALIDEHLRTDSARILLIDGARQVGKTTSVRRVGQRRYPHFIEINMIEDQLGPKLFAEVRTVEEFYLRLSLVAGNRMGTAEDTLVFIDEIQAYPHLLTLLKFLAQDRRFAYVASGSLLGVTLAQTPSIPMGSIRRVRMYPLDFEEFLMANGVSAEALAALEALFRSRTSPDEATHERLMGLFRRYLLVGGMPDAVNAFLSTHNIVRVRAVQEEIHGYYGADASKYDTERRLKIRRIYDLIPSVMENKKKRMVMQHIENRRGRTFADYRDEFDYLIGAGIALSVQAVSDPRFPLTASVGKNLLKLYLSDAGLLSAILFGTNARAILDDVPSVNLGSLYETVVASELQAHGYRLFYYDNRSKGEVDYLIDDDETLSAVPIEVKSGKDYTIHSALNAFVSNPDYNVREAFVLSNARTVTRDGKITYLPIYFIPFFRNRPPASDCLI